MTEAIKAEQQKYYDALLIRGWRLFQTVRDVEWAFKSIFGVYPREADLLRTSPFNKVGVRRFVAGRLPKISERLLNQPPEKDALLLQKLQTSNYTTLTAQIEDPAITAEAHSIRGRWMRMGFETMKAATRNRDTDWNIVK